MTCIAFEFKGSYLSRIDLLSSCSAARGFYRRHKFVEIQQFQISLSRTRFVWQHRLASDPGTRPYQERLVQSHLQCNRSQTVPRRYVGIE
jgi:hypothetical protein